MNYTKLLAIMGMAIAAQAMADTSCPQICGYHHHKAHAHHPKKKTSAIKPESRDPLKVDPGTAVANSPAPDIDLPGVMHIQGENRKAVDFTDVRYIDWKDLGSQTVYISIGQPNLIKLPFSNPAIIEDKASIQVNKRPVSSNVYVTWIGTDPHPSQIFIEPPGGGSESLSLELVPKNIPSQTVIITDDVPSTGLAQSSIATSSSQYVTRIQGLMASVALNNTPSGMTRESLNLPPIAKDGLIITPLRRYTGLRDDIYVYRVENPGKTVARLHEQEFDGPKVLAVSIYPSPLLQPSQSAELEIVASKDKGAKP